MKNKKAQLGGLGIAIITLVIAATFLILGMVMLQEIRDTKMISETGSETVSQEVVNLTNGTNAKSLAYTLLGGTYPGIHGWSINSTAVVNQTSGATVPSTNWTISDAGVLSSTPGSPYWSKNVNVTYSFLYGGEVYKNANTTLVDIGGFSDFWEIIVLALAISIIIGLILIAFGGKRNR